MARRGGANRGGGRKWSRKRKAGEAAAKAGKPRANGAGGWGHTLNSNARLEAYYSRVGLHDTRYDAATGAFVPCVGDAEKHAERERFLAAARAILPASFRVDRSLDPSTQGRLLEDLRRFAGEETEVEIELPRRSVPFGGMKSLLEQGTEAGDEDDDGDDDAGAGGGGAGQECQETKETSKDDDGPVIVKRTIAPAKPIPFISSNSRTLGYQLSVDRRTLRRNKSLEPLHNWLKIQTDCGHITRQETVSMIPPVVLNAKEGMSILDMCAAPGSKTCQLLEVVGAPGAAAEPTGFVVANDADPKRAYMLVCQLRRMNSPAVFVTSCDGQDFPLLDAAAARGTGAEGTFDRVLADVPCSGDGTLRKNPGIWKRWNHLGSLGLHPLQLAIARRGARLTRVGGYLTYSTCSLNPMENESVVAELLRGANGALVLEDPRGRMEGLLARPGWSTWKVLREGQQRTRKAAKNRQKKNNAKMAARRKEWEAKRATEGEGAPPPKEATADADQKDYSPSPYDTIPYVPPQSWEDAALSERTASLGFEEYASFEDVEPEWRQRVRASCFPPTAEEAKRFALHKCLRCLPQDMDTGGFFIALLKKVKPLNRNATAGMDSPSIASKGGGDVDTRSYENDKGNKKKSATDSKDSEEEVAITNLPGADGKKGTDSIKKEPQGKVGHNCTSQNSTPCKKDLSNEPFIPCDNSLWPPIIEEFGLTPDFPRDQFMVRRSSEAKILYFISKSIKEDVFDRGIQDCVTVINSGLKGFERCSLKANDKGYRLAQEGIQYVVPYMTKRILTANMDDFTVCVKDGFTPFDAFSDSFQKELEQLTPGSFLVTLEGHEKDIAKKMYLVMWRRDKCVECFVAKIERDGILMKMRALGDGEPAGLTTYSCVGTLSTQVN